MKSDDMDEINQKPTEEMLAEARRVAFFADEVLSQEITDSYEKTDAYIKRHAGYRYTDNISDEELIKEVNAAKLFSAPIDVLAKRTTRCTGWILFKAGFLPTLFFAILSVYFLTTPIENWIWSLGSYNHVILEFFPRAKTWVNISVEYREKMIVLYACFMPLLTFAVFYTILLIFKSRKTLLFEFIPDKRHYGCRTYTGLLVVLMLSLLLIATFISITYFGGSEKLLASISYNRSIHADYKHWNTLFGFIFNSSASMFGVVLGIVGISMAFGVGGYCKKINKFKLDLNKKNM